MISLCMEVVRPQAKKEVEFALKKPNANPIHFLVRGGPHFA